MIKIKSGVRDEKTFWWSFWYWPVVMGILSSADHPRGYAVPRALGQTCRSFLSPAQHSSARATLTKTNRRTMFEFMMSLTTKRQGIIFEMNESRFGGVRLPSAATTTDLFTNGLPFPRAPDPCNDSALMLNIIHVSAWIPRMGRPSVQFAVQLWRARRKNRREGRYDGEVAVTLWFVFGYRVDQSGPEIANFDNEKCWCDCVVLLRAPGAVPFYLHAYVKRTTYFG